MTRGSAKRRSFAKLELGRRKGSSPMADDVVEHPPFTPTLPQVNLLPASVRDAIAVRKVRSWLVTLALLVLLGAATIWYVQTARIAQAERTLAAAVAEAAALQEQADSLTAVTEFDAQLASQQALVEDTLAAQVRTTELVRRLTEAGRSAAGGAPIAFISIGLDYPGIPEPGGVLNPCPNPDPFGSSIAIGCLTFTAIADDRQQVSRLLEALAADPFFVGPYVGSTALSPATDVAGSGVTFTGTAGVSVDALQTPLTVEEVEAILAPPPTSESEAPADEGAADPGGAS